MPSKFDYSDIAGGDNTETAEPGDAVSDPPHATYRRSRCDESRGSHHISGTRVRIVTLEAEVELLEAERETLVDQVTALESTIEELENEVAALERTIECKDQQRQQVRDNYEHVIAAKDQAYQELQQELEAAPTGTSIWPLPDIKPPLGAVVARVQRVFHDR